MKNPFNLLSDWVKYRTVKRYHVVNTGMEPGYVDVTERMLHVNFNMLKDFVEIEKAHMWEWCENPLMEQPGVSYLAWEMGLERGHQAKNAREIYELYDWWTNQRQYRIEKKNLKEDEQMLIRLMKVRNSLWT